jgi:hypothetical protein
MDIHKIAFTYHLLPLAHFDFKALSLEEVEDMVTQYMGESFRREWPQAKYPCVNIDRGNHYGTQGKTHTFLNFEFGLNVPDDEAFLFCIQH